MADLDLLLHELADECLILPVEHPPGAPPLPPTLYIPYNLDSPLTRNCYHTPCLSCVLPSPPVPIYLALSASGKSLRQLFLSTNPLIETYHYSHVTGDLYLLWDSSYHW